MEIAEALKKLDPSDDSQWNADGLPGLDIMKTLTGRPKLSRREITEAIPEFTKDTAGKVFDKPLEELADKPPEPVMSALDEADKILEELLPKATSIDRKKEIDERINDLNQQKGVIELEVDVLLREQTRLQTSQFVDNSAAADTKARLYYVAQQNRIRAEKAKRGRAFLESGANLADINPKSALDQAFSRNKKRGTARPPVRALKME